MARTSMANLISLVRDLIGDPAGAEQTFSDDQIERSLDIHRWEFRYLPLKPLNTIAPGNIEYRDWYSDEMYWESDAVLYDGAYTQLTPSSSDPLHGRWSFTAHQPEVRASGKVYDPYGAAADLLEMWAGKSALEFDVDADGASMKRSQKQQALRDLATVYRRQQRIITAQQVRYDIY
ncbi:MAG TPA: hypothetical protein VIO61_12915 [Anaerolineaceae bacterium]